MKLTEIQRLYDHLCKKYNTLSVKVYFVNDNEDSLILSNRKLDYKGLYIETPFRKIFLNVNLYNIRTVYHEIFHHLNPVLLDGTEFEDLLDIFIKKEANMFVNILSNNFLQSNKICNFTAYS